MLEYSLLIVKAKGQFLLCKRSIDQYELAGYWSCPGGKVEVGEDPAYSAYREFLEETNISIQGSIKKVGKIKMKNYLGNVGSKIHIYLYESDEYIYPQLDYAVDGKEHSRCGYFKKDDLPYPITDELKEIIEKL